MRCRVQVTCTGHKVFTSQGNLNRHEASCAFRFFCPEEGCGATLTTDDALKTHVAVRHTVKAAAARRHDIQMKGRKQHVVTGVVQEHAFLPHNPATQTIQKAIRALAKKAQRRQYVRKNRSAAAKSSADDESEDADADEEPRGMAARTRSAARRRSGSGGGGKNRKTRRTPARVRPARACRRTHNKTTLGRRTRRDDDDAEPDEDEEDEEGGSQAPARKRTRR